jgi:hypothetical protein
VSCPLSHELYFEKTIQVYVPKSNIAGFRTDKIQEMQQHDTPDQQGLHVP